MRLRKLFKRLLRRFLDKTYCVIVGGNHFRKGDILSADRHKHGMLVLRKDISLTRFGVSSKLYCVQNKIFKSKFRNWLFVRFYTWLAEKDLIC
jgi:hypothetical protein